MIEVGLEFQVTVKVTEVQIEDLESPYKLEFKDVVNLEPIWVDDSDIAKLCPDLRIQILEDQKKAIDLELESLKGEETSELG